MNFDVTVVFDPVCEEELAVVIVSEGAQLISLFHFNFLDGHWSDGAIAALLFAQRSRVEEPALDTFLEKIAFSSTGWTFIAKLPAVVFLLLFETFTCSAQTLSIPATQFPIGSYARFVIIQTVAGAASPIT